MKFFIWLLIFSPFLISALPTDAEKKTYSDQIKTAFELQSIGKTRRAFYVFKDAYQSALHSGMSPAALAPLQELFVWYRRYGFSCGLTKVPANCVGEYRPDGWDDEECVIPPHTPRQEKLMGDFLCGVGNVVSGVFCISLGSPFGGPAGIGVGTTLILNGVNYMYNSVMEMVLDKKERELRFKELEKIKREILATVEEK